MKEFSFYGNDMFEIKAYKWEVENPKACIQLIHGKGECVKRYQEFIDFLNNNGFSVYADDHRGHGKTIKTHQISGEIGKDGFNLMVEDEHILTNIIKRENPNTKIFIFAHSLGSFILQEYLIRYENKIDKVILSGSSGKMGLELTFGKILAYIEMKLRNKEMKGSKILEFLNFTLYKYKFLNSPYGNLWLHRVNEYTDFSNHKYLSNDKFPAQFFYYIYSGIEKLHIRNRVKKIPQNIQMFIISGEKDPVSKMGKGIEKLYSMYKKVGMKNIQMKLYKECRHELLNEINKHEVYEDILEFINN